MSQLLNEFTGILQHPLNNFINLLISTVRSFTEADLSDTDNIARFESTTLINLINLLCVLLFRSFYFH